MSCFQKRANSAVRVGKLPQNKFKNRCENLIACKLICTDDETCVILKKLPDDAHSDYGASPLEKRYSDTNTQTQHSHRFLTHDLAGKCSYYLHVTKCKQYWPDIGKKKKYGDIIVLHSKQNVFADYCFRTFHSHSYLNKLLATLPGDGPVVVHCSTGVGRTGTLILCDICLYRVAVEGLVDVFAEMAFITSERANIIDNKQHYLLAHLVKELKEQLPVQHQRALHGKIKFCDNLRLHRQFTFRCRNTASRIYLKRYPTWDEDSDYLSAVYVDGVKLQNQYLATQLLMPSTINDFWRMIAEFKVELILMLQPLNIQDFTCCVIAPARGEFKPTSYLNITAEKIVRMEYHTSQKLLLVDNSEVDQFDATTQQDQSPPPVMTMVTFWQAVEKIARGDEPIVTLCHITECGLYLALSFLLERMTVEKKCDVYLVVQAVRRSRPEFVRSLVKYQFHSNKKNIGTSGISIYNAVVTYLEYFETYENFS
ncbi:Receptor-type tyrosine-protein phosphatase kappa [Temnothorax longispinosus]|uniref:Receptor-type tyrosine-protein phosphatase kappa n=1 Tax=Temnothorax longispinosus TaxID=300112 RepID=A0A4S2JJF7_9HYME|nr:Receptor-type tyrosine-protein phosphatase kappa [Temnothorax longispinosus]